MGGLESSTIVLVEAGRVCGASRLLHLGPGLEDSAFCDDHRLETGDALFGPRVDIGWFFDDELHLDDVIVGIVLRRVSERLDGPVRGISRRDRVSELIACCGERAGGLVALVRRRAKRGVHDRDHVERDLHLVATRVDELVIVGRDIVDGGPATSRRAIRLGRDAGSVEHELGCGVEIEQAQRLAVEVEQHAVHFDIAGRRAAGTHRVAERGEHLAAGLLVRLDDREPRVQWQRPTARACAARRTS